MRDPSAELDHWGPPFLPILALTFQVSVCSPGDNPFYLAFVSYSECSHQIRRIFTISTAFLPSSREFNPAGRHHYSHEVSKVECHRCGSNWWSYSQKPPPIRLYTTAFERRDTISSLWKHTSDREVVSGLETTVSTKSKFKFSLSERICSISNFSWGI
jgi:hypothetical protein